MTDEQHTTRFIGQWDPSQFVKQPNGLYTAHMHVKNKDLQEVTGLPGHTLFSENGIQKVEQIHTYGGDGVHSTSVGFVDNEGNITELTPKGTKAATIFPNGKIVVGVHYGEETGITKPFSINLDTSKTHLPSDAALAMAKYSDIPLENIQDQTFNSYKNIGVGDMEYCLLPKGSHVRNIIETHAKDPRFFDGVYSKGNHIVQDTDHYLVSKSHFDELYKPLVDAKKKTQSGFVIRTTTHKRPTNPVGYQFSLTHGPSTGLSTVGDNSSPIDIQTNENILATLAKMGIQGDIKTSSETEVQEEV